MPWKSAWLGLAAIRVARQGAPLMVGALRDPIADPWRGGLNGTCRLRDVVMLTGASESLPKHATASRPLDFSQM
jgi:hypothetical protein